MTDKVFDQVRNNPWLLVYFFIPFLVINFKIKYEQQFVFLAYSLIHGNLSFIKLPQTIADLSYFNGQYYWPLGIFPAISLAPFVFIFGTSFRQGFLQFPLTLVNFWLILKISKILQLEKDKSIWLAIFFLLGSVYTPVGAISFSWYFAHIVATTLLLLSIFEFLNKRRWLLIGIILSLAVLTRNNLILSIVFFLPTLLKKPIRFQSILRFILPVITSLFIIGIYNFQRFGSIFESGYSYQLIPKESADRRATGMISIKHVPANLYYMLIKTPDPVLKDDSHVLKAPFLQYDPYGMSLFFMSPILFLLFRLNLKDKYVKEALITTIFLMLSVVTYYGIGYKQVGYRYALDFFPFLLIPLTSAFKKADLKLIISLVVIGVFLSWFFTFEKLAGF